MKYSKYKLSIILFLLAISIAKSQITTLLDFVGSNGRYPQNSLYYDGTFLYGTTIWGGTTDSGTVFKIKTDGTGYANLINFSGTNGSYPWGALFFDGTYLYGTTEVGGTNHLGTIFKVMPNGTGYTKLLDFTGATNGAYPRGSLISDGTFLYGMTLAGGTNDSGVVFKIKPDGSGYLKLFDFSGIDGKYPTGNSLFYDGTFLYGTTEVGGSNNFGVFFKIMPNGTGYVKLLDFAGSSNGSHPWSTYYYDGTFLYGLTEYGGASNSGTMYKIKPDGSGYLKLFDFNGTSNGNTPISSLISDGTFFYGNTQIGGANNRGIIFMVKPDGSGFTNLFDFTSGSCGNYPIGSLISDGTYLYGMTNGGGTNGYGTVFKFQYGPTEIDHYTINKDVEIYPNPTSDQFYIRTNTTDKLTVDLYDVNGRHVFSSSVIDKEIINVTTLDNGAYTLTIKTEDRVINKKLIILR